MKKYSKIYKLNSGREYRYNFDAAVLEFVTTIDYVEDDDRNITEKPLNIPDVLDSVGLSRENWKDSPDYWIGVYDADIEDEISCLMHDLKEEFNL